MGTYNAAVMESTKVGTQIMPNATPCITNPTITNGKDLRREKKNSIFIRQKLAQKGNSANCVCNKHFARKTGTDTYIERSHQ